MMPQKEVGEAQYQLAGQEYGRYEEQQRSSARQRDEAMYEQNLREGASNKVYPPQRNNANILRFSLAMIALGLVVFFGLLFILGVGGTTGWASFAVACFAVLFIAGIGMDKIR